MYQLSNCGVLRLSDGASIPADDGNADWRAYLAWVDEGNVAQPEAQPVEPIQSVTPIQALMALDQAGMLPALYAYISADTTPLLTRLAFTGATEWRRDSLLVMNAAIALNLSSAQVDGLFASAASIKV